MIILDYQDRTPIYEQIVQRFKTLIIRGALEPDSQMPSVRSLAGELSINPNTIQKAYRLLEADGFIYTIKGRGNFVSADKGIADKHLEEWRARLRVVIMDGRMLGVSLQEAQELTLACYREGSNV